MEGTERSLPSLTCLRLQGDPAWPNAQSWLEASWCQPSSERHFIHVSFLTNPMCSALPQIAHGKLGPKVPFPLHGLWVWPSVSLYALWARELILPPTESSTHLTTVSPEQTWSPEGDWPTYQREPDCQLSPGLGKQGRAPGLRAQSAAAAGGYDRSLEDQERFGESD